MKTPNSPIPGSGNILLTFCLSRTDSSHKLFIVTSLNTEPAESAGNGLSITLRIMMYALAAYYFSFVSADPDLWGHIRFGQDIWNHHSVHATDPFSYTAQGQPWVNHEWLVEVTFYLLFNTFGSTGLLIFKTLLGILIIHLLSSLYFSRAGNVTVYLMVFALILPVIEPGMMTRPHLATFLGLTLMVCLLQKFFDGNRRVIRWMPLLMLVWVNSHGGVVAGLGIFGTITAIEFLRCLKSGESHGTQLLKYFLISCVAVLVNPYGYHLWTFFVHSLGQPRAISEWESVTLFDLSHWQYKLLTLLFLATLLLPVPKRAWQIIVIGLALVYGYRHQRHTVLTAILLTPYLSLQYARWKVWDLKAGYDRLSNHFHWAVHGCLILFTVYFLGALGVKYARQDFKISVDPVVYPTYAAQFMEANQIQGNLVVPFNWGEYMIWKSPGSKVSIDGRFRTVYPEDVIRLNEAFALGKPEGMALIEDPRAQLVLTKKYEAPHTFMEQHPGWQKIYHDPIAKLFIRKGTAPPNQGRPYLQPTTSPPWAFPG